jgi:HEAT repeat protein
MPLFGPPEIKKLEANRDIKKLVKALSYEETGETAKTNAVRAEARDALARIGPPAVDELIRALNNPSASLSAVITLGKIGDARAVEPLIAALQKSWIEPWVIEALANIGDRRAVEPILGFAKNSTAPGVPADKRSLAAVSALGKLGDPRAVKGLNALLGEPTNNDLLRAKAAEALDQIGSALGAEALVRQLNTRGAAPNISAEKGLIQVGAPAIGHLLKDLFATGDPDGKIAESAGRVFAAVGEPAEVRIFYAFKYHRNWDEAGVCLGALGWIGSERSLNVIVSYLNHQYRGAALTALEQIGDHRVVIPLINYLSHNSGDQRAVSILDKVAGSR